MNFYVGCLIIFLLILVITIGATAATRRKPKTIPEDDKEPEPEDDIHADTFDLYESIYDFMTKQNQYIRSLG